MARLVDRRETLPPFAVYHMKGFWDDDGTKMIGAIRRVVGRRDLKVKAFPWWLLPLAAPFSAFFRELKEMRYLWQEALLMENDRLLAAIGSEPSTPIDEAVRAYPRRTWLPGGRKGIAATASVRGTEHCGGCPMTQDLSRGVAAAMPYHFTMLAVSVPALIGGQLFLVGFAVFADGAAWAWHRALGGGIGVVVFAILIVVLVQPRLRPYRRSAILLVMLYCFQFVWLELGEVLESGGIRALHAANAVLLTATSVQLARRATSRAGSFSS